MIKEYSQNRANVIMNFSIKYCDSHKELLESTGFLSVIKKYVDNIKKKDLVLYKNLKEITNGLDVADSMSELFKLLVVLDKSDVAELNADYKQILTNTDLLVEFIEGLYSYWRSLERYAVIQTRKDATGLQSTNFIEANDKFNNLILSTYRKIEENILGYQHSVYRQLNAGINAGVILNETTTHFREELDILNGISFVSSITFTPPFIIYPKMNKRSGFFEEVFENPIKGLPLNKTHYFVYPAMVGESLTFIYFHRDYFNHGIALCNLFELAKKEDYMNKKPDLVYVFGQRTEENVKETVYYHDKKENMYFAFASSVEEIDYFGYMKKMILTLYNSRMIDQGYLPIHGAMVHVTLKTGEVANVVIMGDSGAGKSESLEAFRKLSDEYLKEIKIIFDDMGTFKIIDNEIYGFGTEIGAFVRLDDLEEGYAFTAFDRGIFMNPDKINARLLYPVSTYNDIMRGYKVDIFLYANNYEEETNVLQLFENVEDAKKIFVQGNRKAKGTTSETGIVSSFFANPFGMYQRQEKSNDIINTYFDKLFENKIDVGQLYTKLAIDGQEQKGPEEAAKELFKWMRNRR